MKKGMKKTKPVKVYSMPKKDINIECDVKITFGGNISWVKKQTPLNEKDATAL